MSKVKRIVSIATLASLALASFLLEMMLPPLMPFAPGAKLGISNVFAFLALIMFGKVPAIVVFVVRSIFGAIFSGNLSILLYGGPAGAMALFATILLYELFIGKMNLVTISIVAAVIHNAVQVAIASIILQAFSVLWYMPYLMIIGAVAGFFTGSLLLLVTKTIARTLVIRLWS